MSVELFAGRTPGGCALAIHRNIGGDFQHPPTFLVVVSGGLVVVPFFSAHGAD